ncbi:2Fe-2S iron-sulfur cluster binding domain protein [Thermosipho africanus Ob7]|jgi:carbon-monoxide dehydrogenase small subunit|uniref:2Fe-2S iron-sulfur cluster binding domain protein n=1 Tax=Thermosipho africanus (strain TCF52B) TaxID=484019 RepID=B7IDM5_THEAB|nr:MULTISPECIES: (2Fe-2S)-binding protein [Thermosipho]ACJ76102.1 2Fe-2S iron-sulfur cluster binding domain protein [Thermosipho africanus TCF52B]MBZ4650704.1 2Fe-2S iron-sulfur cluster binding domain protein [Thermosipho sp. (in: thermotogales)]RDI92130.1 2Fe-2S iron-sulfur cluster binding domain protein [Thermosipho africanus Ob7]
MKIKFTLNGQTIERDVPVYKRALDFLRDDLKITSVKEGCGEGECGACTIIVNGKNVHSCLMLAVELDGKEIITLEGIEDQIKDAYVEAGAIQCGFCTPGFIVSTKVLLDKHPNPSEEEIKEALEGNLCRCTGYVKIINAVKIASSYIKGSEKND